MRVLVVDDHAENRYYLQALLSAHGYEVELASHGAEALVLARRSIPGVVISDLLMPVMDGYTLLRHWKADARLKRVPFIVYTATYTEPEDERLALSLGADAFILKPTEPEVFLERLRAVESKAGASAPAPPLSSTRPDGDDGLHLREYSETLVRKLEQKMLQLEETNRALARDIAARQEAEAALRETEERFRQLAENIGDVFWLSSAEKDRIYYVSPAYETVFERSCASLRAAPTSWLEAVHPEDRERIERSLVRQGKGHYDEVYRIVRSDRSIRWIRVRAYAVPDASGRTYRIAGVSRDITEQRLLEERFRQALKMEAVGRFAGGIAHDFNNVLSVILTYTTILLDELPEGPFWNDVQEVSRAGARATELTQQLLAFSRQQVLTPRVVNLGDVVAKIEKMLQRLLGEDIALSLDLASGAGEVYADPSQLEQVIMNLAVNARDAMPRGGRLSIATANAELDAAAVAGYLEAEPGAYVVLVVTDTGVGMDAATRERIFEPFFTTKEKGKGTGFGLATVFGIVQQSKGLVSVVSEPGQGAIFKVYLPRVRRVEEAAEESPPSVPLPEGSETILVVEDDEQLRSATRRILRRYGYNVLEAQDGGEACAVAETYGEKIDLLLTDVVMPHMSGRQLAERLAPKRPDMRVLYVSGYGADTTQQHGVVRGPSFLEKPLTPPVLLRKVREVLTARP
jgi:two-component system cell cycle sensor histidine kinase/response regulator CckA